MYLCCALMMRKRGQIVADRSLALHGDVCIYNGGRAEEEEIRNSRFHKSQHRQLESAYMHTTVQQESKETMAVFNLC